MRTRQLTAERLRELLSYDPESGIFRWRVATSNRIRVGGVAGYLSPKGYILIRVDGCLQKAHRLAWLWVTGSWPAVEVDHRDGNRSNNRFLNLRDTTRLLNGQNHRKPDVDSKTGFLGVTKSTSGRYRAQIAHGGRNYHLGTFDTAEEAHQAYVSAKRAHHPGNTL